MSFRSPLLDIPCAFHRACQTWTWHHVANQSPIKLCPIFGRNSAAAGRLPAPGKKEARPAAVDGWVGPGWKVAAWVSARQSGSRAIGRQPSAPGWTRWRRLRLAARMAGTCCLEPAPASEPRLRLPAGGDQLSEDTIVDRWTADHPATQPGKLFTTQPTLLLFARSYIKVHTLFQFS